MNGKPQTENRFKSAMKTNATAGKAKPDPDPEAVRKFVQGAETHSATAPEQSPDNSGAGLSFPISTKKLRVNAYDARLYRSQSSLSELRADMSANGQKHAIQITETDEEGFHIVIDGRRRWLGTEANGLDVIEAKINHDIDPKDPAALYWASYIANHTNEQHRDYDNGLMWGRMIDEGVLTLDQIQAKTGKSKSTISQMTCYRKLTPEILSLIEIDPDKFPYTVAYQISRLVTKDKPEDALKLTQAYALAPTGVRSLQSKVEAILDGKPSSRLRKGRVISNQIDVEGVGSGNIAAYDNGTLQLTISGLNSEHQAELVKRIQAVVEGFELN